MRTKEHASFRPKRPMGNNENFQDNNGETVTKNLNINADMVGCVIGRGGSFISHIRRVSGARLHVSEQQGSSTERTVTIMGTDDAVNKAMKLLYAQLESEKERREQLASEKSGVVQ
jgi:heterogeneous nuclear rnp K-like protein 2